MPLLTRESLAHRFRQNWMAKHPVDTPLNTTVDDSLTSLNWLQNLNIMKMAAPTPPASPEPQIRITENVHNSSELRVNPNAVLNMTNMPVKQEHTLLTPTPLSPLNCKLSVNDVAPPTPTTPTTMEKTDYKTNPYVKPPYSYATLICMAMRESQKMTLAGIYSWIQENFLYYRVADPSWQNSIRHNLSLNKCFQKVPRRKDEPGKGGFWRINPEYSDMFVNGVFKKRRSTPREPTVAICPPTKKLKRDHDDGIVSSRNPSLSNGYSSEDLSEDVPLKTTSSHEVNESLSGDFNWNAILQQDIEVGGIRIKAEDLIDDNDSSDHVANPITTLSPPPSDSNSDVALDDLLNAADFASHFVEDPVDLSKGALDLTVEGHGIKPPSWWAEPGDGEVQDLSLSRGSNNSGLNTPITRSPVHDHDSDLFAHPWSESRAEIDEAIASFDLDLQSIFDESITAVSAITDS